MNSDTIIFFLSVCIAVLVCAVLYQHYHFRMDIRKKLKQISDKLKAIMDEDSDERIMVFTDHRELINLMSQINLLLEDRLKVRAGYRRMELSSKKMLSNISHDIKTPMTVILGYLQMMRLEDDENKLLAKVEQQAERVMELVNQFFTLAKLEAGDTDVALSKINVCEVCRENVLDFYGLLTQKDFHVEISVPEAPVYVLGNRDALQRILFNLLSNAVRYGADGKYIGIFLRTDDKKVFIDIVDKGKGIDKAFADTVFDRLFTMEDSRNRDIQGNGLGLTIARGLARRMGGDITLESRPLDKTVFTVTLKAFIELS